VASLGLGRSRLHLQRVAQAIVGPAPLVTEVAPVKVYMNVTLALSLARQSYVPTSTSMLDNGAVLDMVSAPCLLVL
jgi:hypothetical protein